MVSAPASCFLDEHFEYLFLCTYCFGGPRRKCLRCIFPRRSDSQILVENFPDGVESVHVLRISSCREPSHSAASGRVPCQVLYLYLAHDGNGKSVSVSHTNFRRSSIQLNKVYHT